MNISAAQLLGQHLNGIIDRCRRSESERHAPYLQRITLHTNSIHKGCISFKIASVHCYFLALAGRLNNRRKRISVLGVGIVEESSVYTLRMGDMYPYISVGCASVDQQGRIRLIDMNRIAHRYARHFVTVATIHRQPYFCRLRFLSHILRFMDPPQESFSGRGDVARREAIDVLRLTAHISHPRTQVQGSVASRVRSLVVRIAEHLSRPAVQRIDVNTRREALKEFGTTADLTEFLVDLIHIHLAHSVRSYRHGESRCRADAESINIDCHRSIGEPIGRYALT